MTAAALVICDVWDTHWCATARAQADELAPRIDRAAAAVRRDGGVVIHAPSQTDPFYEASVPYRRAKDLARPLVPQRRPPLVGLPVYDTCPCDPPCPPPDETGAAWPWPWRRQHEAIQIADTDFIACDDGDVVHGIVAPVGFAVALCGLHLDRCILDRPFGAKALWAAGIDVVILEDLTEPTHPSDRQLVLDRIAEALPVARSDVTLRVPLPAAGEEDELAALGEQAPVAPPQLGVLIGEASLDVPGPDA